MGFIIQKSKREKTSQKRKGFQEKRNKQVLI